MARSPGFGSAPYYSSRPLKTRFRFGSVLSDLTSHHGTTRRFILQKARHHPLTGSDFFQAHGFRFSFTPLPRFFSPFPHGTGSLSLTSDIQPWRMVPPASDRISRVPSYSGFQSLLTSLFSTGISPSLSVLSITFLFTWLWFDWSYNPVSLRFGLIPVRSPLLGKSLLFSSPPVT